MSDITHILGRAQQGDRHAADELLPLVYAELHRLAASRTAREAPGQTLQTTALVHEAWLRLVRGEDRTFAGRTHFIAVAADAMRRILIEEARRRSSRKRGGNAKIEEIEKTNSIKSKSNVGTGKSKRLITLACVS